MLPMPRPKGFALAQLCRPLICTPRSNKLRARLIPISIHGGDAAIRDGGGWQVPKRDLVGVTQLLLQQQWLRIAPALPESATLTKEFQDYRVKISATGDDSYDARVKAPTMISSWRWRWLAGSVNTAGHAG